MTTYLLANSVQVRTKNGTTMLQPGKVISDALYDIAALQAAGAQLVPQADTLANSFTNATKRKRYRGRGQLAGADDNTNAFPEAGDLLLTGDVTVTAGGTATVKALQGNPVASGTPAAYQQLTWNGTAWVGVGLVSATLTNKNSSVDCAASSAGADGNASQFVLPASTLTANHTLTLGTDSAVAGETITLARLDATAHTYAVINGGAGAGTLITLPASQKRVATFSFDGTNWSLVAVASLS